VNHVPNRGSIGPETHTYEATFPSLVVKGILLGKLHMQTVGKATLNCPQTGYSCSFDFKSKGLFSSGKSNALKAKIYHQGNHVYSIHGFWDGELFLSPAKGQPAAGEAKPFFNAAMCPSDLVYKVEVPVENRPAMDSKIVWEPVARGIHNRSDHETFTAKDAIEERQRLEEAERVKQGIPWVPHHFVLSNYAKQPNFYVLEKLSGVPPFVSGGMPTN